MRTARFRATSRNWARSRKITPATAAPVAVENGKASYDDMKQTLENRVAKAASDSAEYSNGSKFIDEQTPSLPNSNKSLNQ